MKKRPLFTKEFKLEAVRLLERGDKPAADLARELGIRRNQIYKWKEQLQAKGEEQVFPKQRVRPYILNKGSGLIPEKSMGSDSIDY